MDLKAKLRPFYVAKMLYERTDEDHFLTIAQIMDRLEKDYGISTSRGTVGDDIKALQELGVEIEVVPSTQKRFSLIGRRICKPNRTKSRQKVNKKLYVFALTFVDAEIVRIGKNCLKRKRWRTTVH